MVNNRKNGSIPLLSRQSGHLRNKQRRESSIYFCGENKNKPYSDYNNTQINEGVPHTMNFETCCSCSKPPNSVVCWRGWMCLFVCTKCFLELAYLWSLVNRFFFYSTMPLKDLLLIRIIKRRVEIGQKMFRYWVKWAKYCTH